MREWGHFWLVWRKRLLALSFVFCFLYICGQTTVVAAMSTEDEVQWGQKISQEVEKQIPLVKDPLLQARVQRIGASLAAVSDRPNLSYTFKVLDSKDVNAFAVPGGFIYVYKGLIDLMPSDDELAGVLGHEIGHIVKRHTITEMEQGTTMTILLAILTQGRGAMAQAAFMEAVMAGHSRGDEREADYLGFIHSTKAGYSPYSMLMGLEKLAVLEPKDSQDLFSDHPESKERIRLAKKYLVDAKVHPYAKAVGLTGVVYEGDWSLPPFTNGLNGSDPLYRAYSAAGQLYQLTLRSQLTTGRLFASNEDTGIGIYYDDRLLFMITNSDALARGVSLDDFAATMIQSVAAWIRLQPNWDGHQTTT